MLNTLKLIAARLDASGYPWLLGGETALAMHGLGVRSQDLLIYTDRIGSYDFGHHFRAEAVTPVHATRKGSLTVHEGDFRVRGIPIRIIGDPVLAGEDILVPLPMKEIVDKVERMSVSGQLIPVIPLEWMFIIEIIAGATEDRLQQIAEEEPSAEKVFQILQRFGLYLKMKERVQALLF